MAETEVTTADVCVVGGGAAGSTLAAFLAQRGRSVVVLERGPRRRGARAGRERRFESVGLDLGSQDRVGRTGLGGDGLVWGRAVVELEQIDLEATAWRPGWPITITDLEPWYAKAREILEIPPRRLPAAPAEPVFLRPIDRSPVRFGSEPAGTRVHLNTRAAKLLSTGSRADAVEAVTGDRGHRVEAEHFVVAAGGIATPALLQASGLGGPLVGHYFADHPYVEVPITLPPGAPHPRDIEGGSLQNPSTALLALSDSVRTGRDIPGAAASLASDRDDATWGRPEVRAAQRLLWGWRTGEVPSDPVRTTIRAVAGAPAVARSLLAQRRQWDRVAVRMVVEPVPHAESTVMPPRTPDGPPRVDWRLDGREYESLRVLLDGVVARFEEAGWGPVEVPDQIRFPDRLGPGAHHMGATRMARDLDSGVVDSDCRVFGTDNVFVAGPSVFPSFGYANPMATIVALAARLAHHLT